MANTTIIVTELRAMEHLTRTEIAVARARIPQARTDAVRRELAENARNAGRRARDIAATLRDLGTVPDVFAPALGWTTTLLRTSVEQAQPLAEALLSDMMLEHQLAERARHLLALTDEDGPAAVHRLAERLLDAHNATIDWLRTVLAEHSLGGPAALRPTPFQAVAAGVTRLVGLPARLTVESLNRAAHRVNRVSRNTRHQVEQTSQRVGKLADDAAQIVTAGAQAAADQAESVARQANADGAAAAVHTARANAGAVQPEELPIPDYDRLNARDVAAAVRELDDPSELTTVDRYETRHKNRAGVRDAVQDRTSALAHSAASRN